MKSAKCSQCGFVGWEGAEYCKKCGAEASPATDGGSQTQQSHGNLPPRNLNETQAKLKTGLAVSSLVVGIVSCLTFGGLLGIGATIGLTLGLIAIVKANRSPAEYGGKGLAIAGVISSVLSIVVMAPIGIIAAIAIPNLMAARIAANEGASIGVLRKIYTAEATYQSVKGKYGDLNELASEHLIDSSFASSEHNGYRFAISGQSDPLSFEITGVPVSYRKSGVRSFYVDETSIIRAADKHGGEATKLDPPFSGSPYRRVSGGRSYDEDDQ